VAESGDHKWALEELMKMDKLLPDKYYIKFFLGLSRISVNEPLDALKYLEEALNLEPEEQDISSIYSYMGVCLKELERYSEAIEALEKGEEYDNERTDIHNLMGFCYFKLEQHQKAIECFRNVLRLNPSSAIDYANIASNYREMGETEKAISHYRLALDLDPTIDFARENLERLEK
jgi:ribosomal protein S12 methylthiotransferase accessory factor